MAPRDLATDPEHPLLFRLVAAGILGLAVGGGLVPSDAGGAGVWGLRVGFVGFLLLVFGVAGYVAIAVFERHPEA